jgi:hypothetical protein
MDQEARAILLLKQVIIYFYRAWPGKPTGGIENWRNPV